MADGFADFGYEDPNLDRDIDNNDYDDEQEVDRTRHFQPGANSTPYHGGEQYEMQTMMREHSGLPSYDERTPLLSESDKKTDELFRRLHDLENFTTGLIDIREIDTSVNPLSEEDGRIQIERVRSLIKKQYPNVDFTKLGPIGFSKKTTNDCSFRTKGWRS